MLPRSCYVGVTKTLSEIYVFTYPIAPHNVFFFFIKQVYVPYETLRCAMISIPFVPNASISLWFPHIYPVSLLTLHSAIKYSITTSLTSVLIHNTQPTTCTVFLLRCLHHNTEHSFKFQSTRDHHQRKDPNNTA